MRTLLFVIFTGLILQTLALSVEDQHHQENTRDLIMESYLTAPTKTLFKVYHVVYEKTRDYDLNSEEGIRKYRAFKANLKIIESVNAQNLSYKYGLGPFTDMTAEEFKEKMLMKEDVFAKQSEEFMNYAKANEKKFLTPKLNRDYIDWKDNFRPIKNQKSCGSCWAFATCATLEANYRIQFGTEIDVSEQQLVDCDPNNGGCNGGNITGAMKYLFANGSIWGIDYPYTGTKGVCNPNGAKMNKIVQERYITARTGVDQLALLARGPLYVTMDASGCFQNYKYGIIENPTCSGTNHAVVLVAIKSSDDGKGDYYVVRNSWGSSWGDKGYFKIRINDTNGTCGIQGYSVLTQMEENPGPFPPVPVPRCVTMYDQANYLGNKREACVGGNVTDFNILSYKLGDMSRMGVFTSLNCKGSYTWGSGDRASLSTTFAGKVKSIFLYGETPNIGCVWIYDNYCLSGAKVEVCESTDNFDAINFSNRLSSVQIGVGVTSVSIYAASGSFSTFSGDNFSLFGSTLDKKIIKIVITK